MKLKDAYSLEESYDQYRQHIKKQRHYFVNKGPSSQGYCFSSSHVWMWELDYKERGAPKNWCFWTVVLDKILESPLDCKEIQPVHSKVDQSWVFIGRTDVEAENSSPLATWCKKLTHWKRPLCWERLRAKGERGKDEMVGWHHQLNGHEFVQTHVHRVDDAVQPSHPLSSHSPPACNLSQHQGLFQWVGSLHQVANELGLQHQSFQWIFRVDLF